MCLVRASFPRDYDPPRRCILGAALLDGLRAAALDNRAAVASAEPLPRNSVESYHLGVSPEYFESLGIRILAGRGFQAGDARERVVIVTEGFARCSWPGQSPLGKTLVSANADLASRLVVGIVPDAGPPALAGAQLVTYVPVPADALNVFLVRGTQERLEQRVGLLVAGLDPALRVEVVSGAAWIAEATPLSALGARVVGEFGVFTLVLAGLGLFSLFEYTVRQRTREIGIRTALGARPRHVLRAVLSPAARVFARGLFAGAIGAVCAGYVMRRFALPSGVDPLDLHLRRCHRDPRAGRAAGRVRAGAPRDAHPAERGAAVPVRPSGASRRRGPRCRRGPAPASFRNRPSWSSRRRPAPLP